MDAPRARKLADRISQIVAEMLERRIKDPRLGFVTVTEARLTNDLREATVFYTVYGTEQERADELAEREHDGPARRASPSHLGPRPPRPPRPPRMPEAPRMPRLPRLPHLPDPSRLSDVHRVFGWGQSDEAPPGE